jgi:hypothetical protein
MSSLFATKHRSRQRLETSYKNVASITGLLVIGTALIFVALFLISNQTTFRCVKYPKPREHDQLYSKYNDVCIYESKTILANSGLFRAILPKFLTGYTYYYYLGYIKQFDVHQTRHYDQETDQTTYSYDVVLVQDENKMNRPDEKRAMDNFFKGNQNLIGGDYNASTLSQTITNYIFPSTNSFDDASRLGRKLEHILRLYEEFPKQPIHFNETHESWMDEVFLAIGTILIVTAVVFLPVLETIKLDDSTQTLLLIRKSFCGYTLLSEYIPINLIDSFYIETIISRDDRFGSRRGTFRAPRSVQNYKAFLKIKNLEDNGAFLSQSDSSSANRQPHRVDQNARRGIGDLGTTGNDDNNNPTSPTQVQNQSYSHEAGEDGEYVLMNRPHQRQAPSSNPHPPPPPPPPTSTTTNRHSHRIIPLLCDRSYGEGYQGAVLEYINIFNDWIRDFKNRQQMEDNQREHIMKLAEQALGRQVLRQQQEQMQRELHGEMAQQNPAENGTEDGSSQPQGEQSGQNNLDGIPTAPTATELTDDQINFLLRRRNARILDSSQSHAQGDHNGDGNGEGIESPPSTPNLSPSATNNGANNPSNSSGAGLVCCVCLDEEAPVKTVLMPCKHLILCNQCAAACDKCPLCRRDIAYTMDVFF